MNGSDEIKLITDLLDELKKNYNDVMRILDDMDGDDIESALCDEYKHIIDTIRGIKKYKKI